VVLLLHDQALRAHGGRHGLRDEGRLDSALFRPVARLDFSEAPDVYELAACYAYGLAAKHPFVDGNKRTAWSCALLFLKVDESGVCLAPADVVVRMLDRVETTMCGGGVCGLAEASAHQLKRPGQRDRRG
jgi:death-on-curing protein